MIAVEENRMFTVVKMENMKIENPQNFRNI